MAKRKGGAGREESWAARVIGFTGGGRWLIYLSTALSALSSACSFVPFVAVYLVLADVVAVYPDFAALEAARMAGLGWMALGGVAGNIGLYLAALLCAHSAAFDAEYNLKLQIVEHLGRVPLGRLEELGTGRVGKVMDESVGAIEGFLAHSLPDMAAAFTAPVAIVVLLFVFDWRFGLAAVACVVAAFGVEAAGFSNKSITDKMRRHLVNQERMTNATVEYVRGMPVVKAFGQTAESFGRLSAAVRAYTDLALDVELDGVSFSYGAEGEKDAPLALDGVSLTVPEGTTCALVGPSGAGKSTVASLVARFWDVSAGAVRIGGVDVRDIDPDELMGCVSLVFQDVHLFRASMLENIRMARPGATREEVVAAARAAQADAFIRALPQGYDTVYGSEGVHLSGGEAQRVSIARAILADRPIVVLDEATAFSDPENEHLIQKAFERLMAGKTVIMIAHRLSTVAGADQIAVIDGGRVVERGRHEELLAAHGTYARMWERYTQALSWDIGSEAPNGREVA